MKKRKRDYMITVLGFILLILGLYFAKNLNTQNELLIALPYVFVGLGCGIFGHGMGNIISGKALKNNINLQKQIYSIYYRLKYEREM